jgi:hypothetical protein
MMISSGFSSMLSFRLVKQYAGVATLLPSQSGTEKNPLHVSLAFDAALRCVVTIAANAIMASNGPQMAQRLQSNAAVIVSIVLNSKKARAGRLWDKKRHQCFQE